MKYNIIIRRSTLLASLMVILFAIGCEYDKREPLDLSTIPAVVSFSTHVEPTFQANCTQCHNGNQPPDLTPENAYFDLTNGNFINIDNPKGSVLYEEIIGNGGMAEHSNDRQRAIILKWIQQGALDN